MTRLVLVRHAENDFVRAGKLAGWTPGVHLNEEGRRQADLLGRRLAGQKLAALYSSPLERAVETAQAVVAHHAEPLEIRLDPELGEVQYGQWTGQRLRRLARTRLWHIVQNFPSGARFPDGESIREMQSRAVTAVERCAASHGGTVVLVSHGDVIKALVAHYAGIHLDLFQRISIAPASMSIIEVHPRHGPRLMRLNDTAHYDLPPSAPAPAGSGEER